ncbi:MAG: hypothetical protein IH864_00715 [Chloroflexi bacterium]|nr:hypothetical protein [Chloroflexota bacterium]
MTSEKIIVLVCDKDDSKHGEITIMDDPQKAERLVETLLEAGFEKDRIRVFAGRTSEFQISHRPVVALVDGQEGGGRQPAAVAESSEVEPEQPVAEEPVAEEPVAEEPVAEEPAAVASAMGSGAQEEAVAETKGEQQSSGAETAAPIRFSSLFRSA